MKHIKKINENFSSQELDFEDFKLILEVDIDDQFSNLSLTFDDYSNESEEPFYDCFINLPTTVDEDFYIEDLSFSYDYLQNILPDYESPEPINGNAVISDIETQINKLERSKSIIDNSIRKQKMLAELFSVLNDKTIPRLKEFSNCREVTFGFDIESIRICFELPFEELKKPNIGFGIW